MLIIARELLWIQLSNRKNQVWLNHLKSWKPRIKNHRVTVHYDFFPKTSMARVIILRWGTKKCFAAVITTVRVGLELMTNLLLRWFPSIPSPSRDKFLVWNHSWKFLLVAPRPSSAERSQTFLRFRLIQIRSWIGCFLKWWGKLAWTRRRCFLLFGWFLDRKKLEEMLRVS